MLCATSKSVSAQSAVSRGGGEWGLSSVSRLSVPRTCDFNRAPATLSLVPLASKPSVTTICCQPALIIFSQHFSRFLAGSVALPLLTRKNPSPALQVGLLCHTFLVGPFACSCAWGKFCSRQSMLSLSVRFARAAPLSSFLISSFAPAAEGDWGSESVRGAKHPDPL